MSQLPGISDGPFAWGGWDKAETVGHLPSPVDKVWWDPLLDIPHEAHSLKKGQARAVRNNNLMLTVALTESQVQAQ